MIKEKALTRLRDQLNAERRRLPMVKIEKDYSDFNYDFHVTLDAAVAPVEYNYRDKAELVQKGETSVTQGESHGLSVFLREGDSMFHTYSTYARGTDLLAGTYNYLDLTPLGRQEDWEEPPGRSNSAFLAWLRHHDRYEAGPNASTSCCSPGHDHSSAIIVAAKALQAPRWGAVGEGSRNASCKGGPISMLAHPDD